MTLLAISFSATHMSIAQGLWRYHRLPAWSKVSTASKGAKLIAPSLFEPYLGGAFVIYDWEKNKVTWQIAVDGAAGFCWKNGALYINQLRFSETVIIDGHGRELGRLSHKLMNRPHTIIPTQRGFLITSTATDSILEIDHTGELLYEWCALDHGYNLLKNGQTRLLDRSIDQRFVFYPTNDQTTHINSACFVDARENVILATLFHQGTVIAIDRQSGSVQTLISGLKRPHDIRPYADTGWIVSNTEGNQTLLLDKKWNITRRMAMDFNWIQSSAPLADGSIVVGDSDNQRLVRVYIDDQRAPEIRAIPPDWRIFLINEVPPEYSNFFQQPIVSAPI